MTTLAETPQVSPQALFSLQGQNILITGATRGIGQACAIGLAQAGAKHVILVQRDTSNTTTKDQINQAGSKADIVVADLSDMQAVKGVFDDALKVADGGHIDVLINCGGIQRRSPSTQFSEDDWDDVLNVNLKAVWLLSQAAGRHMVPRRHGKIINFASLLTFQGGFTVPAYASAKGAVGQLTKALSNEWSKENINVNAIAPGYIATDMNEKLLADPNRLRQLNERIPAGRWGQPADFVGPVVFLASEASKYLSGEIITVDGGWMGR
ncbi:hypothetical protein E3P99_01482 [Wallemia hederae]|uniref:Ketoreductase domain-containing protein n=1 Tax=Wallemia hederae TaxID=1540922 RepID=A0A4V4LTI9_9BASI|nr:hypothetical protein E3P99_01482 [Wallemia hederae]